MEISENIRHIWEHHSLKVFLSWLNGIRDELEQSSPGKVKCPKQTSHARALKALLVPFMKVYKCFMVIFKELLSLCLVFGRLFDAKLEDNPQQYQAVQHIVAGTSIPAPYLVFGPPGTGTTHSRIMVLWLFRPKTVKLLFHCLRRQNRDNGGGNEADREKRGCLPYTGMCSFKQCCWSALQEDFGTCGQAQCVSYVRKQPGSCNGSGWTEGECCIIPCKMFCSRWIVCSVLKQTVVHFTKPSRLTKFVGMRNIPYDSVIHISYCGR